MSCSAAEFGCSRRSTGSSSGSGGYWSADGAEIAFLLPGFGEGLIGAAVLEWLLAHGEQVELKQPLVELEITKSPVELPTPQAGKVVRTYGGPGDTIKVGEPLIVFEVPEHTAGTGGTVPKEEAPKRRVRLGAVLDED